MSTFIEYGDKVIFHPGYYVEELLSESGVSLAEFSRELDIPLGDLSRILRGKLDLTEDIARSLAKVSGTSVEYWLNLQKGYDEGMASKLSEEACRRETCGRDVKEN